MKSRESVFAKLEFLLVEVPVALPPPGSLVDPDRRGADDHFVGGPECVSTVFESSRTPQEWGLARVS
jgi:hypothetical protein